MNRCLATAVWSLGISSGVEAILKPALVNNLEDAHELIDTAISIALKESKRVYISLGCNLSAIPHPTFSGEPVPFPLSPNMMMPITNGFVQVLRMAFFNPLSDGVLQAQLRYYLNESLMQLNFQIKRGRFDALSDESSSRKAESISSPDPPP
ncbi:hypothetical protein L1887_35422 [Cichorium endivia]|nr:hypothetical protein L1887_35422 [Cichorium endivia]